MSTDLETSALEVSPATLKGLNGRPYPLPLLRLLELVERGDDPAGCWLFRGSLNKKGYGRFRVNGRLVVPHRFAYEAFCGPIPAGLELDHLCRVKHCVNPFHLEPVTTKENIRRGWAARRELGGLGDSDGLGCDPTLEPPSLAYPRAPERVPERPDAER